MKLTDSLLPSLALVNVRLIEKRRLWLFFIGIITVSMLASGVAAFTGGFEQKDFFLGDDENIVVITQPGASTPVTSRISTYLVNDLQYLTGVEVISPETISIAVLNSQGGSTATVRGITDVFSVITDFSLSSGKWLFDSSDNTSFSSIGVVLGITVAKSLTLNLDDNIMVYGTVTQVVLQLKVTGVLNLQNSPIDEQLFVSIDNGRLLAGLSSNDATLLRVKFNPLLIQAKSITNILSDFQKLTIKIEGNDQSLIDMSDCTIEILTSTNDLVETLQLTNDIETIDYDLTFGRYYVVLNSPDLPNNNEHLVLMSNSRTITFAIDDQFYFLNVETTYKDEKLANIPIKIFDTGSHETSTYYTDEIGNLTIPLLKNQNYIIEGNYLKNKRTVIIDSNVDQNIKFDFSNIVNIHLKNCDDDTPIVNAPLNVYWGENQFNLSLVELMITNEDGLVSLDSVHGYYLVNLSLGAVYWENKFIGGISRNFTAYIGEINSDFIVNLDESTKQDGVEISLFNLNTEELIFNTIVEETENDTFNWNQLLVLTHNYRIDITVMYTTIKNSYSFQAIKDSIYIFNGPAAQVEQNDKYYLPIKVIDPTKVGNNTISGVSVQIYSQINDNLLFESLTDDSGVVTYIPEVIELLEIFVSYGNNTAIKSVFSSVNRTITINLGDIRATIICKTALGSNIEGANITILQNGIETRFVTNSSGMVDIIIPVYSFTLNVRFGVQEYSSYYFFPYGENLWIYQTFYFDIDKPFLIELLDQNNNPIKSAIIRMLSLNDPNNNEIRSGVTSEDGLLNINNLNFGEYNITITISGTTFSSIALIEEEMENLVIIIDLSKIEAIKNVNINKWPGNRIYQVDSSSEYVNNFFQSSLSMIKLVLFSIIFIISVLSTLSIRSTVIYPLDESRGTIFSLVKLGATKGQIALALSLQYTILGITASIIGIIAGLFSILTLVDLQSLNIAGVIIAPAIDALTLGGIIIANGIVVSVTTYKKVKEYAVIDYIKA